MKKPTRLFAALLSFALLLSFTACVGDTKDVPQEVLNGDPIAVSIILGRHANANQFPETYYDMCKREIQQAVHGGIVTVVINDGEPKFLNLTDPSGTPISFGDDGNNDPMKAQLISARYGEVVTFLQNEENRAQEPETDLLRALKEARASLNVTGGASLENHIVIMDTGISTTGDLAFQNLDIARLSSPEYIESIVDLLKQKPGTLPDLTGISISFIGLGDVAYPQIMSDTDKVNVRNLWLAVLQACGAEITQADIWVAGLGDETGIPSGTVPNESQGDGSAGGMYPRVTPIHFEPDTPVGPGHDGAVIPTDSLGFRPNEAVYLDEEAAIYVIEPYANAIASYLAGHPGEKIYLVGSVAVLSEGDDGDFALSLARAETVKATLIEHFGLNDGSLETIGLGGIAPWRVNEFNGGEFVQELAQQNRAVWVLTETSEMFEDIPEPYKK